MGKAEHQPVHRQQQRVLRPREVDLFDTGVKGEKATAAAQKVQEFCRNGECEAFVGRTVDMYMRHEPTA
jgi:hypothetical protein